MCGINGLYNYSGKVINDERSLIEKMNACIRYRGPDDEGFWSDPTNKIHFGHLRLSIIDLSSSGHQPMKNDNGDVIVFNGEIYNYEEIRPLAGKHNYKSGSDTEVMLRMYEKYGEQCLNFFNGMFALALWDPKKEELFLARDRAGKKPLYYTEQGGIFAFSSEIKSLLALPWVRAELDEKAFYHFLTFNLLPPPLTMFKNIFKFHPGYTMTIGKDGIKKYQQYWDVQYTSLENETFESLKQKTFENLEKSVKYRMVSDVPVGAFLSGGVDSSAMVAMMRNITSNPIKTYSIGFEGQPEYDELEQARYISKMFSTQHFEKIISADDIKNFLPTVVDIFDEPLADATCIPIYFISQKAREQGTIVVLNGDGSDELFAGYSNYSRYLKYYPFYHSYSKIPVFFKKIISGFYKKIDNSSNVSEMLHRAYLNQEFFWGGARSFKESVKRNLLSSSFLKRSADWNSYEVIEEYRKMFNEASLNNKNDIDWMCYLGFKMINCNQFLFRSDRLGMAHSIEARSPFLDYNFVNFALSVPGRFKNVNGEPKYILKKALEKILPHETLYRKKMGFCVPLNEWGNEIMLDYVETNLNSFTLQTGLLNKDELKDLINRLKNRGKSNVNDLWTIYFLISWFKKWMAV